MITYNRNIYTDERDPIANWVVRAISATKKGTINLDVGNEPAVKIDIIHNGNKIIVDLLQPALFKTTHDEIGFFDKLKTAKGFAHKLSQNGVTISILRKGKEAIKLGKDARPTISRVITRTSEIEIDSIRQTAKLKSDLKAD